MIENVTATTVAFENVDRMIENGWEVVFFNPITGAYRSLGSGSVIMTKQGEWDTRNTNGVQKDMRPKRGETSG